MCQYCVLTYNNNIWSNVLTKSRIILFVHVIANNSKKRGDVCNKDSVELVSSSKKGTFPTQFHPLTRESDLMPPLRHCSLPTADERGLLISVDSFDPAI